jgi:uncharacterized protein (TIGR02646 family)
MEVFYYPKGKHKRVQNPRKFRRYRTYKKYLQLEFGRTCVYCRQPDTSAPNLSFGVDHYRPKSVFPALVCDYENLYYCCGNCNTYKSDYWPIDEKKGPVIVNPCDHVMASHLHFDKTSGEVNSKDFHGAHTVTLLNLNDPSVVEYRLNTLMAIAQLRINIIKTQSQRQKLDRAFSLGKISPLVHGQKSIEIEDRLKRFESMLESHTGAKKVKPLPSTRLGVRLSSP